MHFFVLVTPVWTLWSQAIGAAIVTAANALSAGFIVAVAPYL